MKARYSLILLVLPLSLAACASPRIGVGAGYGVGDVRLGVSTRDLGRTVTPSVGVRSGKVFGVVAGPNIRLYEESLPPQKTPPAPPLRATEPVTGEAAPGIAPGTEK